MLTPPPTFSGVIPRVSTTAPPGTVIGNRMLAVQLLAAFGDLIEVASLGSGCSAADLAEWAGTLLIRWSERDRAAMHKIANGEAV